ncbi:hydroxyisourate hydrolase [Mycobacterium sp. NPDC003449]
MGTLSTHILDTSLGRAAEGVEVVLEHDGERIGDGVTDADGRIGSIGPQRLDAGDYTLRFRTGSYFAADGRDCFYPEVIVVFTIADAAQHYHVPLLLNPFGYGTYRGT